MEEKNENAEGGKGYGGVGIFRGKVTILSHFFSPSCMISKYLYLVITSPTVNGGAENNPTLVLKSIILSFFIEFLFYVCYVPVFMR